MTWLSLVLKTLPMPPPVLPQCVLIANANKLVYINYVTQIRYNSFLVYYRKLAPGTVSLTDDRAQGDDSKHDSHYTVYLLVLKMVCSNYVMVMFTSPIYNV